jgi:superfamily II DNA helicase RecQ
MAALWKLVCTHAAMVYMLPGMALAPSFQKLWKDLSFHMCLTTIVVEEAQCIAEWGSKIF